MIQILFGCYGGGHSNIIKSVYNKLCETTDSSQIGIIPFTTAHGYFRENNIPYLDVDKYIKRFICKKVLNYLLNKSLPTNKYVTEKETLNYFAVGVTSNSLKYGFEKAIEMFEKDGRFSFDPVEFFELVLQELKPKVVVTTNSPRSEYALIKAANKLNIKTCVVGDLWFENENWVYNSDYANYVCVHSEEIATHLSKNGLSNKKIKVTGNPAFDYISKLDRSESNVIQLKNRLKLNYKYIITWICSSEPTTDNSAYTNWKQFSHFIDDLNLELKNVGYIIRTRPNYNQPNLSVTQPNIKISHSDKLSDILSISDYVIYDNSTVGFECKIANIRSCSIASDGKWPLWVDHKSAYGFKNMKQLKKYISKHIRDPHKGNIKTSVGDGAKNVCKFIKSLLSNELY